MSSNTEKLRVYEEQLAAVEAAIVQDPTNDEWLKLKSDLLEVIRLTQQLSEVRGEAAISSAVAAAAAATELKSYAVGDKCQAVFEGDGNWYNAKVVALVEDGYFVEYLGFGNTAQVDFNEVRPYLRPDTSEWRPGAEVQALAVADSRWYPSKLISVGPASAKVRFHGEAETVELELDSIRLPTPSGAAGASSSGAGAGAGAAGSKRASDEMMSAAEEAKAVREGRVPKSLEVCADDSAEEAARKKRKLNMYKRQEKKRREEQSTEDRRSSWSQFSKKNKTVQRAKNSHDPNWDPTRDHGEIAAQLAIDRSYGARDHR